MSRGAGSLVFLLCFLASFAIAFDNVKILIAVTNNGKLGDTGRKTGYWLAEVAHPFHVFTSIYNWTVDFISPAGGPAPVDPGSVTAAKDDPISMQFFHDKMLMGRLTQTLAPSQLSLPVNYDAIFYAGGHGTCWDFPEAVALAKIASSIYEQGGVVSAVCHGPSGLFSVLETVEGYETGGRLLITGRNVTAFSNAEEKAAGLASVVPFSLQDTLEKLGAHYTCADVMWTSYAVVHGRLVTGENPQSSMATAEAVAEVLVSEVITERK